MFAVGDVIELDRIMAMAAPALNRIGREMAPAGTAEAALLLQAEAKARRRACAPAYGRP